MSTSPERIEDFGEKIGGARKDRYKGTIVAADVASMDADQRKKYCTKATAWPTPDYRALFAAGHTRIALGHLKAIRDGFPAAPWDAGTAHLTAYVDALATLRSLEKCKTLAELHAVLFAPDFGRFYELERREHGSSARPGPIMQSLFDANCNGYRATMNLFSAVTECAFQNPTSTLAPYSLKWLRKNPEWPLGEELWEKYARRRAWHVEQIPDSSEWRVRLGHWIDERTPFANDRFTDANAANTALKRHVETVLANRREAKTAARKSVEARAIGNAITVDESATERDWRDGRDIEGEDYLTTFGFRGGEFGNWVNQAERRDLLNRGFNALCDLADVLNIPRRAISHNSRLGIAFGARGHGGARPASAHYEVVSRTINLTKPHGEGVLCHELGHAYDHALYRLFETKAPPMSTSDVTDLTSADLTSFLSAHLLAGERMQNLTAVDGIPVAVFVGMSKAMDAIAVVSETPDEAINRLRAAVDDAKRYLESWLRYAPEVYKRANDNPEAVKSFTAFVAEKSLPLLAPNSTDAGLLDFVTHLRQSIGRTHGMSDLIKAVQHGTYKVRSAYRTLAAAIETGIPSQSLRSMPSAYKRACLKLDEKRSAPYWSQRAEIFARAFETYVADQLAQRGRVSPFLVRPLAGEAYPQGAERARIIAALDPALKSWAAAMREIHTERIVIADESAANTLPLPLPRPEHTGRAAAL